MNYTINPFTGKMDEKGASTPNNNLNPNPGAINQAIPQTHLQMETLRDANGFVPGQMYKITDSQTIIVDPLTGELSTFAIEQLNVIAHSTNVLRPYASSEDYPNDLICYELESKDILTQYYIYEEGEGSTINSDYKENIVSFNFTTTGFNLVLNSALDLDQYWNFYFENFNNGNSWSFSDTMNNLITGGNISVTNNGGNNYDIAILSVDDNNGQSFDFSIVIANSDQYYSEQQSNIVLGTTKGRITRREDPIQSVLISVIDGDIDYDTADFRNVHLYRAEVDTSSAGYGYGSFYGVTSLDDLVESSSGTWGSVTKTLTVNSNINNAQLLPVFGNYGNTFNFTSKVGLVMMNATFRNDVSSFMFEGTSDGLHFENEIRNVNIGKGCYFTGVYIGEIQGLELNQDAGMNVNFCISNIEKNSYTNGGFFGGVTKEDGEINSLILVNSEMEQINFENTDIESLEFHDGNISGIRIDTPTGVCKTSKFYLQGSNMEDCYFNVTDNMEANNFWIGKDGDNNQLWNVEGEFKNNFLNITDGFLNSDFTNGFRNIKGYSKSIWNNNIDADFNFVTMYGVTFDGNDLGNTTYRLVKLFGNYEGNTHSAAVVKTNFMQDILDCEFDVKIDSCTVLPEINGINRTTTAIIDSDIVGGASGYFARKYQNTGGPLLTSIS